MRRTGAMIVMAVLLLSATSGCGTMCNMAGQEACLLAIHPARPIVPFGGVGNDVRWMSRGLDPEKPLPLAVAAAAIDMPLSCVGDVITLPWTMYHWLYLHQPMRATTNTSDLTKDDYFERGNLERARNPVLPAGGLRDDAQWASPGKK